MLTQNKISVFNLHSLRISERIAFFVTVNRIIENHDAEKMKITSASIPFKSACVDLESRFNKDRKSKVTDQIMEKDQLRDNDIICMRYVAEGMTRYFDSEVRIAALQLLAKIDSYGAYIYKMNQEEETVVLSNLISEIKSSPVLLDAIKKLNMKALLANLEKNNNEFSDLYMNRLVEKTLADEVSAGEKMKEVTTSYRNLVRALESQAFVEPMQEIVLAIAEINTLIQRQIEKINNREGRRNKDADLTNEGSGQAV
jgi:hypothetical protein